MTYADRVMVGWKGGPRKMAKTQRATMAVLRERGVPLSLEEVELEPPRADEALVQIHASGICGTDVAYLNLDRALPFPLVCGHEGAGVVLEVGAGVSHVNVGDRVTLSMAYCRHCMPCLSGDPFRCDSTAALNFSFTRLDGTTPARRGDEPVNSRFFGQSSFATHAVVDASTLVRIPEGYDFALAGPLGCGVQTGAGAVMNVMRPKPGDSLAVFGAGSVGLSAIMLAKLTGAFPIVAIDPQPQRRALALRLGATHALDPSDGDVAARCRAIAPRLDFALDATSSLAVAQQAFEALGQTGMLVSVGVRGGQVALDNMGLLEGKTLRMVRMGDGSSRLNIQRLIDLQLRGVFPIEELVTRYPFAQINAAVADMKLGAAIKPVLIMD